MKNLFKEQLQRYLAENFPEMVHQLNADVPFSSYLEDKAILIEPLMDELLAQGNDQQQIINSCIQEIVKDFPPSKYHYLLEVLEVEFPQEYDSFDSVGVLKYSILNMVQRCEAAFDAFDFGPETMDDRFLRYAVIAEIHDYLIDQQMN